MVQLNRITTGQGDEGQTSLGNGRRVSKTDLRISAFGSVDELNSYLGVALTATDLDDRHRAWLEQIQNDLFDVGADLCVPEDASSSPQALRITDAYVSRLESWTDASLAGLPTATSFILPGGSRAAAHLHVARAVCRRAEIDVLRLHEREAVTLSLRIYLNRLSDLLFILARVNNRGGTADVLWVPGRQARPN